MARSFTKLVVIACSGLTHGCDYGPCGELEVGDRVKIEITEIVGGARCMAESPLGIGTVLELTVEETIHGESCVSTTGSVVDSNGVVWFGRQGISNAEEISHGDFFGHYTMNPPPNACSNWIELGLDMPFGKKSSVSTLMGVSTAPCEDLPCKTDYRVIATRL